MAAKVQRRSAERLSVDVFFCNNQYRIQEEAQKRRNDTCCDSFLLLFQFLLMFNSHSQFPCKEQMGCINHVRCMHSRDQRLNPLALFVMMEFPWLH